MSLILLCVVTLGSVHADEGDRRPGSQDNPVDVVIYGGTSAGIAAAVQVKRMGGTCLLIEPTSRLGGLTTGGLGQTDIGNKAAIGGLSRTFYQAIRTHYERPEAWKWQKKTEYRSMGQSVTSDTEPTMWTFEPSVALNVFQSWIMNHQVPVLYRERLDRLPGSVFKQEGFIRRLTLESGRRIYGQVFLDATYEGDLLDAAGVSFTVGREGNDEYNETLNGIQTERAKHHQFQPGVDPYVVKGKKGSGLLPGIDPMGPGTEGGADHRIQAYCFRMCLTDHPDNKLPWIRPKNYNEQDYELLFRNFEAGFKGVPWYNSSMPNRKTDINNNKGFSTDYIGQNYNYPTGSYAERQSIVRKHLNYQQGLMWTLANHARVPQSVRSEVSKWGPCRDEFNSPDGWQQQLYVREARRMIGQTVMTQHHCQGRETASISVGLAAYTMDSHNVQRHIDTNGHVRNEGDVQVGGFDPYPIDYHCLTPKPKECSNLIVPVCLSASHIAFGSIRMEPVFMVLGQSAATAAMQSIRQGTSIQNVNPQRLQAQLKQDGQVLDWNLRPTDSKLR